MDLQKKAKGRWKYRRVQGKGFVKPGNENKVCKLIKSLYGLKQALKQRHQKVDEVVDDMLIFDTDHVQVDLTKNFLSSRLSIKDMEEAYVILGIRIKHESNDIAIYQSHYIEKCWKVTLMQAGSAILKRIRLPVDGSIMESEFMALAAASKEAEWLKNLLLEISLWSKPIAPISIPYDSAATLAKAYSQMYNGKSRHLGVRHSMICELITNGVVSIEFSRSQQKIADHLTKGLARDLVIKSAEGMGLKVQLSH
ncbi:hypothetical protein Tco_0079053 [Tanacetum coccineum]